MTVKRINVSIPRNWPVGRPRWYWGFLGLLGMLGFILHEPGYYLMFAFFLYFLDPVLPKRTK